MYSTYLLGCDVLVLSLQLSCALLLAAAIILSK